MDQNFSLMAQSRANYYTAGSPVQFVRVELLKGDVTGEVAVCLTFKNVGTEPLTGLVVHFKCKDAAGQVLCEDDFYYEQLDAQPGDVFGSDDAVYVSDTPVSSVEVEQDRAFLNGRGVDLRGYKRVRLQMPRVLPGSIAKTLQQRTDNSQLTCVPQDTEYGWFCACGAFHPNEENCTSCSECGGDRAGIKATLTSILEEARRAAERQQQEIPPQRLRRHRLPSTRKKPRQLMIPMAMPRMMTKKWSASAVMRPKVACLMTRTMTMKARRCMTLTSWIMMTRTIMMTAAKSAAVMPTMMTPARTTSWQSGSSTGLRRSRLLSAR